MGKKGAILNCVWMTIWVTVFFTAYNFVPIQPFGWIMFVVLTLYLVTGFKPKDVLWAAACLACGLIWGQIYLAFIGAVAGLGVDYNVAFALGMVVVTFLILVVHNMLLEKTPLGTAPFVFAGVFFTFSPAGSDLAAVCIALACGLVMSVLCTAGMCYLMKKYPAEKSDSADES